MKKIALFVFALFALTGLCATSKANAAMLIDGHAYINKKVCAYRLPVETYVKYINGKRYTFTALSRNYVQTCWYKLVKLY